jgi:hypothetical protein
MLPQEAVNQFAELYERLYGVKLHPAEAVLRANTFFEYCKAIRSDFPKLNENKNDNNHEAGTRKVATR